MNDDIPWVTIISTTYNREKYIGEAIQSWLMQKTNFSFNIIISDNCSTDNTIDIIKKYQASNHGKITLLKSDKNYGMMHNFFKVVEAANGKYIANCDGDDYWIDEYKLQKQFDFLEKNPDFSAVYTNSLIINEETNEVRVGKVFVWDTADTEQLLQHHDFIKDNHPLSPGHISTFFFRNNLIKKYPEWLYGCQLNDFALYMLISKYGKAKFIDDKTSVYRVQPLGISSHNFSYINTYLDRIHVYRNINRYFNFKYKSIINPIVSLHYFNIGKHCFKNKNKITAFNMLLMSLLIGKKHFFKWLNGEVVENKLIAKSGNRDL
jgi:glycosyltransferase involved in cell wall biosynthesis